MIEKACLGELAAISSAGDKPDDFSIRKTADCCVPVIANGIENDGIIGYTGEAKIKEEAVTVSARGNVGTAFYRNEPYYPVIRLLTLLPKHGIDCKYLYYLLLNSPLKGIGSVQAQLTVPDVSNMEVFFETDFNIQKKIASTLSAIDDYISNNLVICSELNSVAKLLYEYWFVQFDYPDKNGKPYKTSGGKLIWNEDIKRDIPEGWIVKRVGDIISSERGISYSTENIQSGEGVPMLNLATFMPGGGDYKSDGLKHFLGDYPENKKLKPHELIMCNTQQTAIKFETDIIGRAMLVPDVFDGDVVFSHHVNVIRTQDEDMKYYLLYLFNSDYFHKYIAGFTNGTNILGLSFNGVEDYKTVIPDSSILKRFGQTVLEIEKKKSEIFVENEQLTALRDFLLPMLMNGQLKFNE